MKYHIWTIGCQMNSADSRQVGAALEALGAAPTSDIRQADVIVLNTCVVRQSAENRAAGFVRSLKPLKARRPDLVIALMGCMVGVRGNGRLREAFPHVDVFLPPGDAGALIERLAQPAHAGGPHPPAPSPLRGEGEHSPSPLAERGLGGEVGIAGGETQARSGGVIPRPDEPHPPAPSPLRGEGEHSPSPLAERGLGGEVGIAGGETQARSGADIPHPDEPHPPAPSPLAERGLGGEVGIAGGETQARSAGEVLQPTDELPLTAPIPGYVYQLARELRLQQTPAERLLWACLRNRQLDGLKFRRQHPLGRYIADFFCPEKRLVIELEGGVHRQPDQAEYDAIRRTEIEARGLHVLRFSNAEVDAHPDAVLARIGAAAARLPSDSRFAGRPQPGEPHPPAPSPLAERGLGGEVGIVGGETQARSGADVPHPDEPHPPAPSPRSGEGEHSPSPLAERGLGGEVGIPRGEVRHPDGEPHPPDLGPLVSAPVAALLGCNHVCSYCIIPARRGHERSRPADAVLAEIRSLAAGGVREVVLLGQIVDRYGYDLGPAAPRLPELLAAASAVDGIARVRFLTSHPNYFDDRLIEAVRTLPAVCEHIEVPIQAGDDAVLERMRRGYRVDDYRRLIERLRARLPGCAIATDVIVGFPGETEHQFQATLDVLAELRVDVCHVAMYSPRPGTLAARTLPDDVPPDEKKRRLDAVNALQEEIAAEINARLSGRRVEILVESRQKGRWKGRTRTNKLVFFADAGATDWRGRLVDVEIGWTGPWSMIGEAGR